jgi:hypothetical protein
MDFWLVETIPDTDSLFYRFPVGQLGRGSKVFPGVFRENKGSISTDWEKYSTPVQTRSRQGRPEKFAVLRMNAGRVREIDDLTVSHSPVQNMPGQPDNQAHTDIFGLESPTSEKPDLGRKEKIRTQLYERFNSWEIPPNAPVE